MNESKVKDRFKSIIARELIISSEIIRGLLLGQVVNMSRSAGKEITFV